MTENLISLLTPILALKVCIGRITGLNPLILHL